MVAALPSYHDRLTADLLGCRAIMRPEEAPADACQALILGLSTVTMKQSGLI